MAGKSRRCCKSQLLLGITFAYFAYCFWTSNSEEVTVKHSASREDDIFTTRSRRDLIMSLLLEERDPELKSATNAHIASLVNNVLGDSTGSSKAAQFLAFHSANCFSIGCDLARNQQGRDDWRVIDISKSRKFVPILQVLLPLNCLSLKYPAPLPFFVNMKTWSYNCGSLKSQEELKIWEIGDAKPNFETLKRGEESSDIVYLEDWLTMFSRDRM
jgi:hypothetical protein